MAPPLYQLPNPHRSRPVDMKIPTASLGTNFHACTAQCPPL
jgi:hypothetical protein